MQRPDSHRIRFLRYLLYIATLLLIIGISSPLMTLSKFMLLNHSFSVLSGAKELLLGGQYFLFIVIAGFSIVLPVLKLMLLHRLLWADNPDAGGLERSLHLMHDYGRWAMLDVMVVAVLVVTVKLGAVASVEIHYGLYIFGAATLLIMLITQAVVRVYDGDAHA